MERPLIDFAWTPTAGLVNFSIGSDSYPPSNAPRYAARHTPISTLVTFTAVASPIPNQQFLYYEWDFGDGRRGSGKSVSHVYPFITVEAQVSLTVVDTKGRVYKVEKMINLFDAPPPPDLFDIANYVNSDSDDYATSNPSTLVIDPTTHRFTLVERLTPQTGIVLESDTFDVDSSSHFLPWTETPWTGQTAAGKFVTVTGSAIWLPYSNVWFYDDRVNAVGDVSLKFQIKNTGFLNPFHVALGYQPGDNDAINAYINVGTGSPQIHIHQASVQPGVADFTLTGDTSWPAIGSGGASLNKWVEFKRVGNNVTLTLYDTNGFTILAQTTATIPAPLQARFGTGTSGYVASGAAIGNPLVAGSDYVHHWDSWTITGTLLRHFEYSYGFMFQPTAGMTDDVEVTEKVFVGHNSSGNLSALIGDQRWNPDFGIGGKIIPGGESHGAGSGLFGALTHNGIEVDFYNYATFGGWFLFTNSGGPFSGGTSTTVEAGNTILPGTHYFGTPVVAHAPMPINGGYSQFSGWTEYNPINLTIDTFYWLKLRLISNRVEFEFWSQDPAGVGTDFDVKMVTTLINPAAKALFGSGAPGGVGPGGWFSPPPHSYIAEWSYTTL